MKTDQFLRTMIEFIKYNDYSNKSEMLAILRNSIIMFDRTSRFTRKSYQFYEDIQLRVPIPLLKEAKKYQEEFIEIASDIYIETEEYDFNTLQIKPKLVELELINNKEHDVCFSEIQDTIIQGIRSAKYLIWVAVAWFTDKQIYDELLNKKEEGVDIKVIISDDKGNETLSDLLEENFNFVKVPKKGCWKSNIMHDKFCIIDLDYVMHGSYNWSKNAQQNEETLATALDKDFVLKFADEFKKLYKENS